MSKSAKAIIERLKRKRGVRELEGRFLIVCEDAKSAPNYFNSLKDHLRLSATFVRAIGSHKGTQPIQVVRAALEQKVAADNENSGTEPFSSVWCIIDGDYGREIERARHIASTNGIELAITTMCFEYWIILHFEDNDTAVTDCSKHNAALRARHLSDYDKGKCDFRAVVPHYKEASERARKVRAAGIARGELPETQNPCSEIYRLIDAINGARS